MLALLASLSPLLLAIVGVCYLLLGCCGSTAGNNSSNRSSSCLPSPADSESIGGQIKPRRRTMKVVDREIVNNDVKEYRRRKSKEDEEDLRQLFKKYQVANELKSYTDTTGTKISPDTTLKTQPESNVDPTSNKSVCSTQFSTRSGVEKASEKSHKSQKEVGSKKVSLLKTLLNVSISGKKKKQKKASRESADDCIEDLTSPAGSRENTTPATPSPVVRGSGERAAMKEAKKLSGERVDKGSGEAAGGNPSTKGQKKRSAEAAAQHEKKGSGEMAKESNKLSVEPTQREKKGSGEKIVDSPNCSKEAVGRASAEPAKESKKLSGESTPPAPKESAETAKSVKRVVKPKKTRKQLEKEEEVRRWNAEIARGVVMRPRKDDETIDDVHVDWNA